MPAFPHRPLLAVLVSLAAAAPAPAHAGAVLDRIRQDNRVVIAYREASVPFSYLDAQGRPIGYAVDLCRRLVDNLAAKIGARTLRTDFVPVTSANRIDAIEHGRADLECGSTSDTTERRLHVDFLVPHYITGARYAVRADSAATQLSDFAGKRLVSTTGTTPLTAIAEANRQHLMDIRILEARDHLAAIKMVEDGSADGFAMDEVLLAGLISTRPDPKRLKIVGRYLTIEPIGIMIPRGDPEYKKLMDDEMKRLIRSGDATALLERWFLQPIPPADRAIGLPMPYLLRDYWQYPSDWSPQ